MLGEGFRAALDYLGGRYRCVCHVEREAFAASVLAARMQEGSLDEAPIWSDVTTFDGRKWRGKVDCIIAGFPCQDLSVAGRRDGLDGARSGLFFEIPRIADDCGAWLIVLENVAGIASATATVMDAEEGELEERAAARVMGELADRGWNAEWITLSASDVGASHGRARWFCIAWRDMADAKCSERRPVSVCGTGSQQGNDGNRGETDCRIGIANTALGNSHQQRTYRSGSSSFQTRRRELAQPSGFVADASRERRQQDSGSSHGDESADERRSSQHHHIATGSCSDLADSGDTRPQGCEQQPAHEQDGRTDGRTEQEPCRPTPELCSSLLFAPGPNDERWPGIIEQWPWLAPSLPGASSRQLNPCFGEHLMGWPIFWTYINDNQTDDQKTSAAGYTAEWRKMLYLRLSHLFDETSPGLQQTAGCSDYVPLLREQNCMEEKAMFDRSMRLRCIGNGVVPLCAAVAVVELLRRSDLLTADLSIRRAA